MKKFNEEFIQYSKKKSRSETQNLVWFLSTHITLYIVLIFFLIFFSWYTVFVSTHKFYAVSGVSMMPYLNDKIAVDQMDTELARKTSYDAVYIDRMTKPRLYDIVVIERPNNDSVIKRIVAQGGDYITIAQVPTSNGAEFRFFRIAAGTNLEEVTDQDAVMEENGENGYSVLDHASWTDEKGSVEAQVEDGATYKYEENFFNTFLDDYFYSEQADGYFVSKGGLVYVKVPQGQFFYMGDNRAHSTDGRDRGFCDEKYIVGRTEFVVYDYNFVNRIVEVVKFYFSEVEKFFAR